jgi:hypothetical protein
VPGDSLPSVILALQKAEIRRIEVQDPISKIPNIGLAGRVTCLASLQTPELKKKKVPLPPGQEELLVPGFFPGPHLLSQFSGGEAGGSGV